LNLIAFNWRDPRHPEAGGAELHLFEILRRAVRDGDRAVWLAELYPGAAPEDRIEGIEVHRAGTWYNAHLALGALYRRRFRRERFDLVVEDINKVPFFAPLYATAPVLAVVPHLFGTTAFEEASAPIATLVRAHESLIPIVYRKSRFLAISESTRDDLRHRGIAGERIGVVHCGLDHTAYRVDATVAKSEAPTIAFVGRLRRYKGVDWVMRALPRVLAQQPNTKLLVVGDGPFAPELKLMAARLGVAHAVAFLGFLPMAEKVRRMQEAWVVVQPSPKEGWGLTVVEAGACGTAVVAADSPGLRDSVKRDETGLLVPFDDTAAMADALLRVLGDRELRERLARNGLAWAAQHQWPDCAARSLEFLLDGAARD